MSDKNILILGSGMAALGAAHHFHGAGVATRAYDKNDYPGGHTATFVHDTGYIFAATLSELTRDESCEISEASDMEAMAFCFGITGKKRNLKTSP